VTGYINFRIQAANFVLGLLVVGGWLLVSLIKKRSITRSGIERGLLFFFATQLVAVVFSLDPRRSLALFEIFAIYAFVFYRVLSWLREGWPEELIEKTFLIVGAILVSFALVDILREYLAWRDIVSGLPYPPSFERRIYSVLGDANLLACFVNFSVPIAAIRIYLSKKFFPKALLGLLVGGALVIQYFASSRGGMLALATELGIMAVLWVALISDWARNKILSVWTWLRSQPVVLGGGIVLLALPVIYVVTKALQFEGSATHAPIMSSRSDFWGAALEAFKSSPLVGIGPGIYPATLMEYISTPPFRPFLHAHSVPFTFLAESGLLGIVGLLGLVGVVVKVAYQKLADLEMEDRVRWSGICALFGGFAVHMLVDNFVYYFAVGITLTVFLAIWLNLGEGRSKEVRAFKPIWLFLSAVLVGGFSLYSLYGNYLQERGIDAAQSGNWAEAQNNFFKASVVDPFFAFYRLEEGYAWSVLFEEAPSSRAAGNAIMSFKKGIEFEPSYSLNHANLAALAWEAGETDLAIEQILEATSLAREGIIYWGTLKMYAEELGEQDLVHMADEALTGLSAVDEFQVLLDEIRQKINSGDIASAQDRLVSLWQDYNQEPQTYLGFAELAIAQGDLDLAEKYLQAGLWVQAASNDQKIEILITLADVKLAQGEKAEAQDIYQGAFEALTDTTINGWGSRGFAPYSWFVFQRRGLPVDMVPQLPRPDLTSELMGRFVLLLELYQENGEVEKAAQLANYLDGIIH
jgi:O-antigen ligase